MKKIFFFLLTTSVIIFFACSNGGDENEKDGYNLNTLEKDTVQPVTTTIQKEEKAIAVTFTDVDVNAAASIRKIVDQYLNIKNALANDNSSEAANGAKAMKDAIGKLDKSLLTGEQKTAYDTNEEELKEHADHIAKNGDNIKHQRSHFVQMSEVVYELVRDFGAGRPVYHDHCPMARDNQGAMWISETKEIKNPYFGAQMLKCGKVEEVIQ